MPIIHRFRKIFLALLFSGCASLHANDAPNILFFLVDDMGTQDTSEPFLYDDKDQPIITPLNKLYRTPNMEQLASEGIKFTQAYSYSVCSPTRITLLTGQAAPRHRVTQWTHPKTHKTWPGSVTRNGIKNPEWNTKGIPKDTPLLPKLLQQSGYRTLFAGKAHFGPDDTANGNPLNLGFDVNIAGFGGGGPGSYYGKFNFSAAHRKGGHDWDIPGLAKYHGTETFLSEAITLEMSDEIKKSVKMKKPFFAYMSHYAVHVPFIYPDKRFIKNYPQLKGDKLAFTTLVEGMDKSLGDLRKTLNELGVAEDTLIVFFSDNGSASPMGTHSLRSGKGSRFEGGTRVPLMIAWAKHNPNNKFQKRFPIAAGTIEKDLVNCIDIMPSFLEIAGIKAPAETKLDGHSIVKYISGIEGTHRPQSFLCHFPHAHANSLFSTYRSDDHKIIYSYANKQWELYKLSQDPIEKKNLLRAQPAIALKLAKAMIAELDAQNAQYPLEVKTSTPVKPDLSLIPSSPEPLNLGAMIQPIGKHAFYSEPGYATWDGNLFKEGDRYYLVYSRWKSKGGDWLTTSEVCLAESSALRGPYKHRKVLLKGRGKGHWDELMVHNPKLKKFNGKYYLYYISTKTGSTRIKTRDNQRTGVAVSDSLLGEYKRYDKPIVIPKPPVYTLTVNPGVAKGPGDRYVMILKGDKKSTHGQRVQGIALADSPTGPFDIQPKLAIEGFDTEDASLWYDKERKVFFAIYHAHSHIGLITSTDGITWKPAKHSKIMEKAIAQLNGKSHRSA